ncbi:ATP-binding protein [Candidatus Parvarchaeota archaeon]|jgi:hypothetical protein|nr:ATP-binding protein [Candidatus Parvarchaeota archaeon]
MKDEDILTILKSWNFWDGDIATGIARPLYVQKIAEILKDNTIPIVVETGIRRAGKSFISRQVVQKLIERGLKKEETLIINLEDERLILRDYELLLQIYRIYRAKINQKGKAVIVLDEAQEIRGWEKFVRGISERGEAKFVITGSSSKLLSSEFSTLLSGRHITVTVSPLNFSEFLSFRGASKDKKSEVELFEDYFVRGGFPAVALSNIKEEVLLSYFETIIVKDIIQRYNIKIQEKLRTLVKFYITSAASSITYNSVSKFLKMPIKTVQVFSDYIKNSYLLFFLDRFSFSIKERETSPRKVYVVDNGFISVIGTNLKEGKGRFLENLVALTLLKLSNTDKKLSVYYWKNNEKEVDFILRRDKNIEAIQVSYSIDNQKTREREVSALLECTRLLNLSAGTIITRDYSAEETINGIFIKYIPITDWLKDIK